jgi:demethylspheroidene O-methyltransferase
VRVLHDQDDGAAEGLLARARTALPGRGRLLIAEPMAWRGRFARVYLALYLLAMGSGRTRTPAEIGAMVERAGFRKTRMLRVRTPDLLQIMLAEL